MQHLQHRPRTTHSRQTGAALFMALIFLLILTILGVFGMNISRLENLMAGNTQFQTTALSNAEYVLARGVEDVLDIEAKGIPYPSGDQYHAFGAVTPEDLVWSGFTSAVVSIPGGDSGRYIIENAGFDNDEGEDSSYTGVIKPLPGATVQVFLVSAQSESSRGAKRIVQSVVVTDPLAP
ncbi:MAG: PilX N-terminal domain-containing pilus assembly protein [Gammaproteobacteria bacterium]|nr:PilX N-terminal domain-containing pilus assembly protein [Gammaproteobacteria bacterium]